MAISTHDHIIYSRRQYICIWVKMKQIATYTTCHTHPFMYNAQPPSALDDEWLQFMQQAHTANATDLSQYRNAEHEVTDPAADASAQVKATTLAAASCMPDNAPPAEPLIISTKSKMSYLTESIPLDAFWKIPIISYDCMQSGIIKKQIKCISRSAEELADVQARIKTESRLVEESVIRHIDTIGRKNRARFNDVRKISIGLDCKNAIAQNKRIRQLVNNSFTLIARVLCSDDVNFCEIHVKVFNTGKLGMPGVQNDIVFERVLQMVVGLLQTHVSPSIECSQTPATILINSGFNCGYFINRSILYERLIKQYNMETTYDQCTYPGVKCKYYYNCDDFSQVGPSGGALLATKQKNQHKIKYGVTFVVFRTGSVLIMGMCTEEVLYHIYEFLVNLFQNEYRHIRVPTPPGVIALKKKKIYSKKRIVYFDKK